MDREKKVPEIRFEEFSEEWKECKLGDLAEIVRGASPRPIQDPKWFNRNSDIGWLRIADVTEQDGRIHYLEQKISKAGQEKTRVIMEPHLLLSIAATVGKPVINYVKTGVHDGFLIFLNPSFYQEFMFQWLEMFRPKWQKYGQPGSQVNLNSKLVKNQNIRIPPLVEQEKIGNLFQKLDKIISKQEQLFHTAKQFKKAMLQKMFPKEGERVPKIRFEGFNGEWREKKFKEFTKLSQGLQIPISERYTSPSKNRKFYITNEFLNPNSKRAYYIESPSKNVIAHNDDILMTRTGNTGVILTDVEGIFHNNFFKIDYEKKVSDKYFLYYLLNLPILQHKIIGRAGTSTIPDLNHSDFYTIIVNIPSIKEQQKIGSFFQSLDKKIDLEEQKLENYKSLKQALLQRMFI